MAVSASRNVAVLGPIPRDRIITHNGEGFEKYGCALYTVVALAALLEPRRPDRADRPRPPARTRSPIKEMLSAFPNVESHRDHARRATTGDGRSSSPTSSQANRIEQQTGFMNPITPADVEFALHADAFVCVPITDYEVGQATLGYIKANSAGTILLDAHGPSSTLIIGGERPPPAVGRAGHRGCRYVDILKMNLEEAGCGLVPLAGRARAPRRRHLPSLEERAARAWPSYCLRHGVQAVCVTLDKRGCVAYHLDSSGSARRGGGPADRRGQRRRRDRARRLVRRRHGVRLPGGPQHRLGGPLRQRDGRAAWSAARASNVYRPLAETEKQIAGPTYGGCRAEGTGMISPWLVVEDGLRPRSRALRYETLFTVGNG